MFALIHNRADLNPETASVVPSYNTIFEAMTAASEIANWNLCWRQDAEGVYAQNGIDKFKIRQL